MILPESQNTTTAEIYKWYASKPQSHREHLGASLIGSECDRALWQTFRWVALPQFEGRILRLFDTGVREEARVFEELRGIGVELHTHQDGKQISCRDDSGHFGGSVDAIAKGLPEAPKTWAVVEIKTHNAKSWEDVKAKGVADSKPRHYAQMQIYMRLLKLERALYFAVNKDTDHIYTEWVHHDERASSVLLGRAETIINAVQPPAKLSEDPAYFGCKFCDFNAHCHQKKVAAVNCRTCSHSTPGANGTWHCNVSTDSKKLTKGQQERACEQHLYIPPLLPTGVPIDAGEGWVEYEMPGGKTFKNGQGHLTSRELEIAPQEAIESPKIAEIKTAFPGARITKVTPARKSKNLKDFSGMAYQAFEPFETPKRTPGDRMNDDIPF